MDKKKIKVPFLKFYLAVLKSLLVSNLKLCRKKSYVKCQQIGDKTLFFKLAMSQKRNKKLNKSKQRDTPNLT